MIINNSKWFSQPINDHRSKEGLIMLEYKSAKLYAKEGYVQQMPTLEVVCARENGTEVKRYLQPFRNYSFQFSGNDSGDGDYGSSAVIAESLSAIAQNFCKDSAYCLFRGMILQAISYAGIEGVVIPSTYCSSQGAVSFRDFIKEVIEYSKARHGLSSAHDPYEFGMTLND